MESQLTINAVVAGARYAGLGASFCLLKQANGFLDLSFAAAFLVGAYVSLLVSANAALAFLAAILATTFSLFLFRLITRQDSRGSDAYQTLSGFGVALTASGLALFFAGPKHYAKSMLSDLPTIEIGDGTVVPAQYLLVFWAIVMACCTALLYVYPSRIGSLLKRMAKTA